MRWFSRVKEIHFHALIGLCSPGSTVGLVSTEKSLAYVAQCINRAHKETREIVIVIENMVCYWPGMVNGGIPFSLRSEPDLVPGYLGILQAGSGNVLGSRFSELGTIIRQVEDKTRVGVCLDTCEFVLS